jgi:hypothetical protein
MYHRDLWEALGGKDKLAYPCSQVLPTDSLSYPSPLRSLPAIVLAQARRAGPRSLWLINNREICVSRRAGPVPRKRNVCACVPALWNPDYSRFAERNSTG